MQQNRYASCFPWRFQRLEAEDTQTQTQSCSRQMLHSECSSRDNFYTFISWSWWPCSCGERLVKGLTSQKTHKDLKTLVQTWQSLTRLLRRTFTLRVTEATLHVTLATSGFCESHHRQLITLTGFAGGGVPVSSLFLFSGTCTYSLKQAVQHQPVKLI